MGGPCDILIPAAILYDNPKGLAKEEFIKEFKKIKLPEGRLYHTHAYLHSGYYGLAEILNLKYTKQYKKSVRENWDDEYKYFIKKEYLLFTPFQGTPDKFSVIKKSHIDLDKTFIFNVTNISGSGEKYKVGDYISTTFVKIPEGLNRPEIEFQVVDILETKIFEEAFDSKIIEQKVRVRAIKLLKEEEKFDTIEDLTKKHPEYISENIYDFSQKTGYLYPSSPDKEKRILGRWGDLFKWDRKGKLHVLNRQVLLDNISPNSIYANDARTHENGCAREDETNWSHKKNKKGCSLTDLILTSEAIRRGKFDVLGDDGIRLNFTEFIYSSHETLERYEKAVFDTEISEMAREKGWSHNRLLRERLSMEQNRIPLDFRTRKQLFESARIKYLRKKERLKKNKGVIEKKEDEAPF